MRSLDDVSYHGFCFLFRIFVIQWDALHLSAAHHLDLIVRKFSIPATCAALSRTDWDELQIVTVAAVTACRHVPAIV